MKLIDFKNKIKEIANAIRKCGITKSMIPFKNMSNEIDNIKNYIMWLLSDSSNVSTDWIKDNTIYLPEDIISLKEYALANTGKVGMTLVCPNTCISFYNNCFLKSKFSYIKVSKNTNWLGFGCFLDCRNLKEFDFPYEGFNSSHQVELNGSVFRGCDGLERITNFEKCKYITELPAYYFANTTSLKEISLPDGIKNIGENAFLSSGISSLKFPSSIMKIDSSAFRSSSLTEIDLSNNDNISLFVSAFGNCSNLKKIILPMHITMTTLTFSGCSNITTIILAENYNSDLFLSSSGAIFSTDVMVSCLNALKDNSNESTSKHISFGENSTSQLTPEQIAIATNKNWTLT